MIICSFDTEIDIWAPANFFYFFEYDCGVLPFIILKMHFFIFFLELCGLFLFLFSHFVFLMLYK